MIQMEILVNNLILNMNKKDNEESIHPDFVQLNPDDLEIDNTIQVKKTFRKMDVKTADEILKEARNLDEFQKKGLHVAVKYAQDIIIARKGKQPYPKAPFLMVNGGAVVESPRLFTLYLNMYTVC